MAEFPTYEQMAKNVAEKALDDFFYQGKSIREWIKIIAEQEKGSGKWIGIDEEPHEVWECDHCGFVIDGSGCIDPYDYLDTYKFCPNCGARMVEEQESEKINCKSTKCENCINHNYCDYEPQESEE